MAHGSDGKQSSYADLVARCGKGDRRAASRLITHLESSDVRESGQAAHAVAALPLPKHSIGITGPPGAGKSTLLDYLIERYRTRHLKVGVVAVDPSSPFTGGALLGDRIRMSSHRTDQGVFIRSMGSRGATGGLAAAASSALRVLSGAGFDIVLIETVGAGQAETEIINLADSICVVQVPGLGDDIQLMKMGILETADIFVVNKSDRPGARELQSRIQETLAEVPGETCRALRQLGPAFAQTYTGPRWTPAVLLTSALDKTGGEELVKALYEHQAFLETPQLVAALRCNRIAREIHFQASRRFEDALRLRLASGGDLEYLVEACVKGDKSLSWALNQVMGTQPRQSP